MSKGKKREGEKQTKKQTLYYREQADGYRSKGGGLNRIWGLRSALVMRTG